MYMEPQPVIKVHVRLVDEMPHVSDPSMSMIDAVGAEVVYGHPCHKLYPLYAFGWF